MRVYAWPPVGVTGAEWTVADPVNRSRSMLSGRVYQSAAERSRKIAVLNVQGAYGDGGGYIEMLKRLLQGGVHAVRLESYPLNFGEPPTPNSDRQAHPVEWRSASNDPLAWRADSGPNPLRWFTGGYNGSVPMATLLPDGDPSGFGRLSVSGLPPSAHVARVGEAVTVYSGSGQSQTQRLLRPVFSGADGVASLWLDKPMAFAGRVNIGTRETAAFLVDEMPRAVRPVWAAWEVSWSFREVFEDETDGFVEIDPWG